MTRGPETDPEDAPRKRVRKVPLVLLALVVLVALLSPLWLRRLDYFRVRRVEVAGVRYVQPGAVLDQLALDSTTTIWANLRPLEERLKHHPQVRDASISRRLPGTLVIHIVENLPVALVSSADGLRPVDRDGRLLPIEPSKTPVDLPISARKDSTVLQMLDGVRVSNPALFARISEVQWDERGGLRVFLSGVTVRASAGCSAERFAEIVPVEQDLVRRGRHAVELDLRYRDQIVARIE